MKVLFATTKYNYGSVARGISIEYESFLPAMQRLGHEVLHIETWDAETHATYADLNRTVLQTVEEWRPDILFTVQRDFEIWIETLEAIAARGDVALATWITDDSFKFGKYSRFIAPYYDAIATTYDYRIEDYRREGIEGAMYTQWAANEQWLQEPKPATACRYAVSFIGTKYGERASVANRLLDAGIDMHCFGYGWPSGPVATDDIPDLMRDSVISLNFSAGFQSSGGNDRQLKARTFEVPGAGGFLLTDFAPSLDKFYRIGQEIDVFEDVDDLEFKIRYYLAHPEVRDRIAVAGFERTRDEHLYRFRLKAIFDYALQRNALRVSQQESGSARITSSGRIFNTRPLSLFELGYRFAIIGICRMIWGKQRGLKGARRITFEASVALLGKRTFTAKSLPGRLFPYV
jgi:spore maturation protein CgeB